MWTHFGNRRTNRWTCPLHKGALAVASAISVLQEQMSACLDEVALWMRSNRLQLNTAKTEVLWCATSRRQHQIPQAPVRVGKDLITPAASVRDLGIYLDSDTSMRSHVSKTVSTALLVFDGSYAAVSSRSRYSPWSCRWFCHDSITAVPHSSVYRHTRSIGCSPC